ncbi:cytokine receptor common subunit beta isoform X1 [Phascolarctos cinereus]|uniref:Cytokine receptor common subunit beta isoform X1 n=1 Tax=Phascolarctos cinereus TaxID=38626 RepID=A0A6P5JZC0_PHACI|nr:cytokine receptor common subunit beta isoform X1 [Phascolarctos cinereus]
MEGVWRGVFNILLAVSWASTESDIQENIPLQTLNCNNDFRTRIICQWEEVADAQHYLNLTLFRQKYDNEPSKPVFCDSEQNTSLPTCQFQSCIPRTCFIHQDVFVTSQVDIFSFKSDQPLELQLSINLTQNVLPPAPENLKIVKNETKGFLLSWVMPRSWSKSPQSSLVGLTFQVAYKRQWESWEVASTMDSSMSRVPLGYDSLIPDNLYVARVRAKTSRGHTSLWSSEVLWESQKGDAAQPKNLQCFFDGHEQLNCTWEARIEVTRSFSFGLFYQAGAGAKKECTPVHKERKMGSPYVQYRCQIHVQDPNNQSQYTVMVQSKEGKPLPSYRHIKPRTPSIKVKKAGNNYWLQWEKPEVPFVSGQTYEVQYRKSTQSWEEAHREILTIILDMNISETSLEPATEYFARVRAMVTDSSYGGTWSEWSNVCSWRTEKVFPPEILGLVLVITTILVLLGTWCCYTFGARLRTNWENKIPNPSKSRLFQNKNQRIWNPGNVFPLSQESPWEKEEREYSVSSVNWLDSEDRSSVSPLTAVDPQDACSLSSDPDPYPASITLPDEDLSLACSQKMPQTSTPVKDLASGFAFNGPYLRLPQSHSLPNISGQMGSCQAEENKKHPCGSLEYFCLPQGGQGGLVPMTKLVEPGRDRVEKETSSDHPSSREEAEPRPLKEQATPLSGEPREEKNLSQVATSSTSPLKLTGVSGYIAPEDLVLGSEKAESLPLLTMPSSPCPAPESSLSLCLGETKGPLSAPSPAMLALEGYVEVPLNMVSAEAPPENPSPLQVGPSAPNPMDAQQDETITVFHPEGLIVLQQIGDYCFFPSQSQLVSPGHCPEKMAKPQDIQGKEPPGQPLPQVPAIQLFKAMKHQEYLVLPTWDGCRPGQVC